MSLAAPPPDWTEQAACREHDPETWFALPGDHARVREAKTICRGCDVRAACLEWANDIRDQFAILGGLTAAERQKMRRAS